MTFLFKYNLFLALALVTLVIHSGNSNQCYVCTSQDEFEGKCLNTIKTCDPEEDMCLTEYSWEYPSHWHEFPVRQYFVSKKCATSDICDAEIEKTKKSCTYLSYENWKCVECCSDNQCNDHVTMAGGAIKSNAILLTGCIAGLIGFYITKIIVI